MERRQVGPARSDAEAGFRLDSACSTKGVGLKTKSDKGGQSEAESTDFRRGQKRGFESETGGWSPRDRKIRLQLETLLAEKGRLAQENSIYARENRFLREIVEYHNLTMQDVVHLDDGIEDIADDGTIHISLPYSSHSASEVISPAISSPHTPPDSPNSPNSDVQPDSSSPAAAPAPREDANEIRSSSSPKSELPHLILKPERAY